MILGFYRSRSARGILLTLISKHFFVLIDFYNQRNAKNFTKLRKTITHSSHAPRNHEEISWDFCALFCPTQISLRFHGCNRWIPFTKLSTPSYYLHDVSVKITVISWMKLIFSVVSAYDSFIHSLIVFLSRLVFLATDVRKKMFRRSLKRTVQFKIFVYEWSKSKLFNSWWLNARESRIHVKNFLNHFNFHTWRSRTRFL